MWTLHVATTRYKAAPQMDNAVVHSTDSCKVTAVDIVVFTAEVMSYIKEWCRMWIICSYTPRSSSATSTGLWVLISNLRMPAAVECSISNCYKLSVSDTWRMLHMDWGFKVLVSHTHGMMKIHIPFKKHSTDSSLQYMLQWENLGISLWVFMNYPVDYLGPPIYSFCLDS